MSTRFTGNIHALCTSFRYFLDPFRTRNVTNVDAAARFFRQKNRSTNRLNFRKDWAAFYIGLQGRLPIGIGDLP